MSYHRDLQVIILERQLLPDDSISLHISYKGKIDEAICYLDVPFEERHNVGRYDPGSDEVIQFRNPFRLFGGKLYLVTPGSPLVSGSRSPGQHGITIRPRNKFHGIYPAGENMGRATGSIARSTGIRNG